MKKIIICLVMFLVFLCGGYFIYKGVNKPSEDTNISEETTTSEKPKYEPGIYSFDNEILVYDEPSMNSNSDSTMYVDNGAGGNRVLTKEIIQGDNDSWWAKIAGGYICIDDGSTIYLTYVSDVEKTLNDYDNDWNQFAEACEDASLAQGGLGGVRPEGYYFMYTALCDKTLVYY